MFKGFNKVNVYVENEGIVKKTIVVEDKIIKDINDTNEKELLSLPDDLIVVPGFIDKHIHGANNSDTMYPTIKDLENIANTVASEGVSTFLPTTMTQSMENIDKALENIKNYMANAKSGAKVLGAHLEGPFICKKYKGAQVESCIVPCDVETFKHYQEVSGNNIRQVTLAYEENGKDLVHYLTSQNIVASIGHTNATFEETIEGIKNGITSVTHTFNAMKSFHHREAGTVGAALYSDSVYCELIADLVHVCKESIKVLFKCKGKDKVVLITDSLEAKHLPDGIYALGGQEVVVKNQEARLADGTLAGSTLWMNKALKNIKDVMEYDFCDVIDLATKNPALNLNIFDKKGSIKIGKDADFAVVDKNFNVYMTYSEGKLIYKK